MLGVAQRVLQRGPAAATAPALIGAWSFDETSGTTAIDEAGHCDGSYTNVALQQDSLVAGDPGSSVRFFGNSAVAVPHAAAYEVGSYSVVVYAEVQSGPGPGANAQLLQKDRGGLPGGFQIAVCNDGATLRPQVYTKDASGSAIWVGSAEGVGQVVPGTAFMLVMTCGGNGTRVYLDKVLIGSTNNHVALSENNEQIGIGRYRPGIIDTAGFNGWIDEVRFYVGELTLEEIDALADAQDLIPDEPEPPEEINFVLPRVPSAPTGTTIRYVAGVGAHGGTGSNNNTGTVGSPWLTIAHAIANTSDSTATTIVLRGGAVYREKNIALGSRRLLGFYADVATDPLDPANWPIIDGMAESSVTWELVHAGRQEYRTTLTNIAGGSGIPQGMVISGTSQQIASFWPTLGEVDPTPVFRLYPYNGTSGARSKTAFQHTGAVSLNQNAGYNGPGLYRESDGRIHIRLQPIHPSYYGGEAYDKIADKNPANNILHIWTPGRTCFSSLSDGVTLEGIFFRSYDKIYVGAGRNGVMRGCIWQGMDFQNYGFRFTSGSGTFAFEHNIIVGGAPDSTPWHLVKNVSDNGGNDYGRTTPLQFQNGNYDIRVTSCMVLGVFDVLVAASGDVNGNSIFRLDHNYITVRDDVQQIGSHVRRVRLDHNFCIGPLHGHQGTGAPANPVEWYVDHNVVLCNQMRLNQVGQRTGHPCINRHSQQSDWPQKMYHNLFVSTQPNRETVGAAIWNPHYNASSVRINYSFNNIFMWYPRVPPGGSAPSLTWLTRNWRAHDDNYRAVHDGHGYYGLRGPGVTAPLSLWLRVWSTGTSNAQDFADLAAWKASAKYTATIGRNGYSDGIDTNSIEADPVLQGGTAVMLEGDPRGKPASDWKPTATAYKTGAVNVTSFGWPDAGSYEAWRGPSDPDGDWTDIGPQAP